MSGNEQRQSLRLERHIPCALRVKPEPWQGEEAAASTAIASTTDRLASLAQEFEGYCDQIPDRATLNALRTLQRQVDQMQSVLMTNLAEQAVWTQEVSTRRVSLSFDGLEIECFERDGLDAQPQLVEVLFSLPGLPGILCTLRVCRHATNRIGGSFAQIADADLRRLRRYILLQSNSSNQNRA